MEAVGEQVIGRDLDRDAGVPDLALRPHEALGERGLRHEERPRDLGGRQPADHAQRERHACVRGQRWMAAREDQAQALVGDRAQFHVLLGARGERGQPSQYLGLAGQRALAPQPVDRAVSGRGQDPGAGVPRRLFAPALERGCEGVLDCVFGETEVAGRTCQGSDRAPPLLAEDPCDVGYASTSTSRITTGRTSMVPSRAEGIFAAHSIASSSDSASTR